MIELPSLLSRDLRPRTKGLVTICGTSPTCIAGPGAGAARGELWLISDKTLTALAGSDPIYSLGVSDTVDRPGRPRSLQVTVTA